MHIRTRFPHLPIRIQAAYHALRGHPVMYRTRIEDGTIVLYRSDPPFVAETWVTGNPPGRYTYETRP